MTLGSNNSTTISDGRKWKYYELLPSQSLRRFHPLRFPVEQLCYNESSHPLTSPIVGGLMLRSTSRMSPWLCLVMALALLSPPVPGQKPMSPPQAHASSTLVERVGSTGFIQLEAESFKQLTPKQQVLAYWLNQASIAIDPIIYDQMSRFGLRQKRLLEAIIAHQPGIKPEVVEKIVAYTKL